MVLYVKYGKTDPYLYRWLMPPRVPTLVAGPRSPFYGEHRKKIAGHFNNTTNNRMQLRASIEVFESLKHFDVSHSKNKKEQHQNLWLRLDAACKRHMIEWQWTRQDGQSQKKNTWFRVEAWNKRAEIVSQYLIKGSRIMVIGELKEAPAWVDRESNARASIEGTAMAARVANSVAREVRC